MRTLMTRELKLAVDECSWNSAKVFRCRDMKLCANITKRIFPETRGCTKIKVQLFPKTHTEGVAIRLRRCGFDVITWTTGKGKPKASLYESTQKRLKKFVKADKVYEYKVVVTPLD
jgi:hypothetical protein